MASAHADPSSPHHGGNLAFAEARYGRPAEGWLDLSTGINPNPWPLPATGLEAATRLPAPDALDGLLTAARRAYGAAADVAIAAAPGSEIAIRLLPLVAPSGAVALLSPTYGSHGEAWRDAGRAVAEVGGLDAVPAAAPIVVLANPNNPDGRVVEPERLVVLAGRLTERGGLLVVDEAFGDVAPAASLAPYLAGLSAVVLRSLGKFYGLAGLRLGFVAGSPAVVEPLRRLLGDWPVSGAALAAGQAALADGAWQAATRLGLTAARRRLEAMLRAHGFAVVGATDLFVLASHPHGPVIHRGLARRGIWTRAFVDHPAWLRLGLPGDDAASGRLDRALGEVSASR
jgi:cobalamin biosynthesis protein CobC